MKTRRRSALVVGALALSLGLSTLTTSAASAAGLPGRAQKAGDYLASQLIHKTINATDTAYVAYSGTTPNLSLTAEAALVVRVFSPRLRTRAPATRALRRRVFIGSSYCLGGTRGLCP